MKNLGRVGWWVCWGLLASYRAIQLVLMLLSGHWLGWLLLIPEGAALLLGVWNAFAAEERDYRLKGLWVPFCYAAGIFLIAGMGNPSPASFVFFVVAELLSVWALVCLGRRFSVAGAAWVSLCDKGPYRWVRHPQLLARCIFVCSAFVGTDPTAGNVFRLLVAVLLTGSAVLHEEAFLALRREYRDYAERVRWRLLPGWW